MAYWGKAVLALCLPWQTNFLPSSLILSALPILCSSLMWCWHRTRHEEPSWATVLSLIGENQKRKMNSHPPCSTHVVNVGGERKSHGVIHVFMCWKWKERRQTEKTGEGDIHRMLGRNEKPLWLRATARRATSTCSWSSTSHRKVLSAVLQVHQPLIWPGWYKHTFWSKL